MPWLDTPQPDFATDDDRADFDRAACSLYPRFMRALSRFDLPEGDHPMVELIRADARDHGLNAVIVHRTPHPGLRLRQLCRGSRQNPEWN